MAASSSQSEIALNFVNPAVYNKLKLNSPRVYDSNEYGIEESVELPMILIPKGAIFYRSDRTGAQRPTESVPIFFGDRESIRMYQQTRSMQTGKVIKNLGDATITKYKVKDDLRLLRWGFDSIPQLQELLQNLLSQDNSKYSDIVTVDELKLLLFYLNPQIGSVLPTLPASFYRKSESTKYLEYMNRDIANIICKLGFDGWIVLPFDMEKRQGLIQKSLITKEESIYPPEIMMCNWSKHLELLTPVTKGGKRKIKKTRKVRKTRKAMSRRSRH
jgi:hypothetical protein